MEGRAYGYRGHTAVDDVLPSAVCCIERNMKGPQNVRLEGGSSAWGRTHKSWFVITASG
jgi:hypothetical protein